MSVCRVCNAPITWAVTAGGEKVPVDDHEERDYGPGRYRMINNAEQPLIEPIADESPLRTHVDHRTICQQPRAI